MSTSITTTVERAIAFIEIVNIVVLSSIYVMPMLSWKQKLRKAPMNDEITMRTRLFYARRERKLWFYMFVHDYSCLREANRENTRAAEWVTILRECLQNMCEKWVNRHAKSLLLRRGFSVYHAHLRENISSKMSCDTSRKNSPCKESQCLKKRIVGNTSRRREQDDAITTCLSHRSLMLYEMHVFENFDKVHVIFPQSHVAKIIL